jgi:hypothetical protein
MAIRDSRPAGRDVKSAGVGRPTAYGSRLTACGVRFAVNGSRIQARGLRLELVLELRRSFAPPLYLSLSLNLDLGPSVSYCSLRTGPTCPARQSAIWNLEWNGSPPPAARCPEASRDGVRGRSRSRCASDWESGSVSRRSLAGSIWMNRGAGRRRATQSVRLHPRCRVSRSRPDMHAPGRFRA